MGMTVCLEGILGPRLLETVRSWTVDTKVNMMNLYLGPIHPSLSSTRQGSLESGPNSLGV